MRLETTLLYQANADQFNERDKGRGSESATTETYQLNKRSKEYRATKRFAQAVAISASSGLFFTIDQDIRSSKIVKSHPHLYEMAFSVGARLSESGLMLVTAESCTGGWLGQSVTAISGSSTWYERGFITYSNTAKCEMLGVQSTTVERHGAVSLQTAQEMVLGALNRSHAQIGVSITGIAGPAGGTEAKPVGTVCFAWAMKQGSVCRRTHLFPGNRDDIRSQAVATALQGILEILNDATTVA